MLHIYYFAKLKDDVNCSDEKIEWQAHLTTIGDIKALLCERGEPWQSAFSGKVMIAHNHQMVKIDHTINDGDEIAFFPPVTGG